MCSAPDLQRRCPAENRRAVSRRGGRGRAGHDFHGTPTPSSQHGRTLRIDLGGEAPSFTISRGAALLLLPCSILFCKCPLCGGATLRRCQVRRRRYFRPVPGPSTNACYYRDAVPGLPILPDHPACCRMNGVKLRSGAAPVLYGLLVLIAECGVTSVPQRRSCGEFGWSGRNPDEPVHQSTSTMPPRCA